MCLKISSYTFVLKLEDSGDFFVTLFEICYITLCFALRIL